MEDVHPAVVVDVGQHDAHAFDLWLAYAGLRADLRKGAVGVAVIQHEPLAATIVRVAVATVARPMLAAAEVGLGRPLDMIAVQEAQVAVAVIVEPAGAGGPLRPRPPTPVFSVTSVNVPSPLFR